MNEIKRIEELKAFIYGVKLTGEQQGVTINLSYVDSTEMSQEVYIHYNKNNEDEYKASNVAYNALVEGFSATLVTEIRDYDISFKSNEDINTIVFDFKQNRRDNTDKYIHGVLANK